jgi:hypothetical protein
LLAQLVTIQSLVVQLNSQIALHVRQAISAMVQVSHMLLLLKILQPLVTFNVQPDTIVRLHQLIKHRRFVPRVTIVR